MPVRPARPPPRRASPGAGALTPGIALLLAALIAATAWRLGTLSGSGAIAAVAVGGATLIGAGWWGGVLLLTFFVGSTLVSRATKDPAVARGEAKGDTRDWMQVLANGGAPALVAWICKGDPPMSVFVLTVGLSAAAADTWATSIGATSPSPPRHLLTLHPVLPGTSGGVTWRGTLGGLGGAAIVGTVGALAISDIHPLVAATLFGTLGMLVDSFLGATMQGRFQCDACSVETERPTHRCGASARPIGGFTWVTNDVVNAVSVGLISALGFVVATRYEYLRFPVP